MACLVTSGNFFVLFLGWELIGLTSFFLINFWSTRMSTLKSAFKAFTFNKFSDVSLLISILLIYYISGDINIVNFNYQISNYNNFYINMMGYEIPVIEIISFFLIGCAFVKSAQFGFHIWLPDSMEAPVPASALIHSATLVSAGVFILLRVSFLFEYSLYSFYVIPLVGSFTAFFGGLCSVYQSDIKKILAYSTISHCGFLMICYSTYITEYTILYLYIHGFFKASVFLCVGNIIRFSRNYQDFRRMGNFWKYLPFECFMTFICLINLCGLPFSIGFYIKHLLLLGYNINTCISYFIYINILFGAVSGLFYSYRLFYNVFFDFKKAKKILYNQANRSVLNSFYYSNTSLASNIAILSLIFLSYVISLYLFNIFLNSSSLGEGLNIYSLNSSQFEEFNNPLLSTINNIGYINWFLFLIMLLILLFSWRFVYNFYSIYNNFCLIILFIIFFYFFYNVIYLFLTNFFLKLNIFFLIFFYKT
jgi:NADH:ubiquinone oxidoreductase subunit 5 (subunit L)/multisubunit Na+/H+ antiporter MnhA subunit